MSRSTAILVLIIIALVLHLIEEVRTGFAAWLPVEGISLLLFVGTNVVVYSFCFVTLVLSARRGELVTPFAWIFAVGMVLNGVGHVGVMIVRREYVPGGWTAFLLLALSGCFILHLLNVV